METEENPRVSVSIENGSVYLNIGHQHFRLAFDPDGKSDATKREQLEWMAQQLTKAIGKIARLD